MTDLPLGSFWEWLGSSPVSPTILAFHGFGGSPQDFEPVAQALDGLGVNWMIPRLSSFAPKHLPDEDPQLLRTQFLESVHQLVRAHGVERPIVMGYSMGGRMALQYALCYQESVRALILVGATPGIRDSNLMLERRLMEDDWISTIEHEGVAAFQAYWQALPVVASQERIPTAIKTSMRNRRRAALTRELVFSLKLFGQGIFPAPWEAIEALNVPTLLTAGAEDLKYLELAYQMQKVMPHAVVEPIPNAGHTAHLENTPAFAHSCEKFINSLVNKK